MLAAPSSGIDPAPAQGTQSLLEALARRYAWVIVDAPSGAWTPGPAELSDTLLLVTTADLPALRCAKRLLEARPQGVHGRVGLVLNQFGRGQPASASEVAASLDTPLMAAIPVDPRGVGYQVNFGRPCALDRQSPLGRTVVALARRLMAGGIRKTDTSAVAATASLSRATRMTTVEQTRLDLEDQLHARLSAQLEEEMETGELAGVPEPEALRTRAVVRWKTTRRS